MNVFCLIRFSRVCIFDQSKFQQNGMVKLLFQERLFWCKIFHGLHKSFLFYENQGNVQILLNNFAVFTKIREN